MREANPASGGVHQAVIRVFVWLIPTFPRNVGVVDFCGDQDPCVRECLALRCPAALTVCCEDRKLSLEGDLHRGQQMAFSLDVSSNKGPGCHIWRLPVGTFAVEQSFISVSLLEATQDQGCEWVG